MTSPSRTILTGVIVMAGALLLVLCPFVLGTNDVSKTLVAFGLLIFIAGASFVLHGTWDGIAKRRNPSPRRGEGGPSRAKSSGGEG